MFKLNIFCAMMAILAISIILNPILFIVTQVRQSRHRACEALCMLTLRAPPKSPEGRRTRHLWTPVLRTSHR
eukprot:9500331-Pyramimonas_sp.AAC.1